MLRLVQQRLFRAAGRVCGCAGLAAVATFVTACSSDVPVAPPHGFSAQLGAGSNDNFAAATVITGLPFTDTVDITGATAEPGEPFPSCAGGAATRSTVWYAFTPTATEILSPSDAAPIATVVAAYSGSSLGTLTEVGCHSVFGGNANFQAQAGTTYYFQVDGMFGQTGSVPFNLVAILPPANDNFASAMPITALPFDNSVDITGAGAEPGEPTPSCAGPFGPINHTAWYSFTPSTTGSVSASFVFAAVQPVVAVYTGSSVSGLTEVVCGIFGNPATFRAQANQTYFFQVGGLFGQGGILQFHLQVTPPPVVNFFFFPSDPSIFDVVQFGDQSFDPGNVGLASLAWNFGDGAVGTGFGPTHQYAADGDYTVVHTVTTTDGRTASASQVAHVRTHDVAITKFLVPSAASSGQTRHIQVGVTSNRYAETVQVQLSKSVPGGFQVIGTLTLAVPVRSSNRTTVFDFSYTFTSDDAQVGKVTFKADAAIVGARDALPADNEAIAPPTTVGR